MWIRFWYELNVNSKNWLQIFFNDLRNENIWKIFEQYLQGLGPKSNFEFFWNNYHKLAMDTNRDDEDNDGEDKVTKCWWWWRRKCCKWSAGQPPFPVECSLARKTSNIILKMMKVRKMIMIETILILWTMLLMCAFVCMRDTKSGGRGCYSTRDTL